MEKAWKLKELVRELINKGANSVEDIHNDIAEMPFDALERVLPSDSANKTVRTIHDNTVGGVYHLIRKVNEEVSRFADELLDRVDEIKNNGDENF